MTKVKLLSLIAMLLAGVVGVAACAVPNAAAPTPQPDGDPVAAPMDAALYRGVVASVEREEGETILLLEQATGTDFGSDSLRVALTGDTRANFAPDTAQAGDYIEAYYGAPLGGGAAEPVEAIAANRLPPAEYSVFNGRITAVSESDGAITGLTLESLEDGGPMVFHFRDETQVYASADSLVEGARVSVYFGGEVMESYPPQAFALEVRPYAE